MSNFVRCLVFMGILFCAGLPIDAHSTDLSGLHRLQEKAEAGDMTAQLQLAAHYSGKDTAVDYHRAGLWWLKAAEQGSIEGHYNLGVVFYRGLGREPDPRESFTWFLQAARMGYAPAQLQVGRMYEAGEGVGQDFLEAVDWYRNAAEQGEAEAQSALGLLHLRRGTPVRDSIEAARWLRAAAHQEISEAQHALAGLYWVGKGVPRDRIKAVRWYGQAADQGHSEAREVIADLLGRGGCSKSVAVQEPTAVSPEPVPASDDSSPASRKALALFGLPLVGSDLTVWREVLAQKSWAVPMRLDESIETYDLSQRMNEICALALRGVPGGNVEVAEFAFPPYVDPQSLGRVVRLVEKELGPADRQEGELTGRGNVQVVWRRGAFRVEVIRESLGMDAPQPIRIVVSAL